MQEINRRTNSDRHSGTKFNINERKHYSIKILLLIISNRNKSKSRYRNTNQSRQDRKVIENYKGGLPKKNKRRMIQE